MENQLWLARAATLVAIALAVGTSLLMPGVGLLREPSGVVIGLGAAGVLIFAGAQAAALYGTVSPWRSERTRKHLLIAFGAASVLSVPLVAPVGVDRWETWAWVGASIVGSAPLLVGWRAAAVTTVATLLVGVGVAVWSGGSVVKYMVLIVSIGLTVVLMSGLPVWLWGLLTLARVGQAAQARLVATEERLRFARDVHDVLGHRLSVIALKAELAARLAPIDATRAAGEAEEVRRLAGTALDEVRQTVHGYRVVDLREQLTAIAEVFRSSGVTCTVTPPDGDLEADAATLLAAVLREASTNVLRHSKATWCTINVTPDGEKVHMTVANDGASGARPDRHSFGLRGLADRLAEGGGALRTSVTGGVFTLDATVPALP